MRSDIVSKNNLLVKPKLFNINWVSLIRSLLFLSIGYGIGVVLIHYGLLK